MNLVLWKMEGKIAFSLFTGEKPHCSKNSTLNSKELADKKADFELSGGHSTLFQHTGTSFSSRRSTDIVSIGRKVKSLTAANDNNDSFFRPFRFQPRGLKTCCSQHRFEFSRDHCVQFISAVSASTLRPHCCSHLLPCLVVPGLLVAPVVAVPDSELLEPLHHAPVQFRQNLPDVTDGALSAAARIRRVVAVKQNLE